MMVIFNNERVAGNNLRTGIQSDFDFQNLLWIPDLVQNQIIKIIYKIRAVAGVPVDSDWS